MRRLTGRPGLVVEGSMNSILQARVPIIKFTDARTGAIPISKIKLQILDYFR